MTSTDATNAYPPSIATKGQIEPAPRRVRGVLGGRVLFDTTRAIYVWEWPHYPQYYVPVADVIDPSVLGDKAIVRVFGDDAKPGLAGMARFRWDTLDAWYEEDEQIFVHPRNPYSRVDALRSTRTVRIELGGVVLAESPAPVMVFETGLPPRYYLDRTAVNFEHLIATDTETACPYKGVTSGYWSVRIGDETHADLAWSYDFPTRELLAITGLIAFYNEKVDVIIDGQPQERPVTHFS
jgi:uncharacterized protein (DUF427 family)